MEGVLRVVDDADAPVVDDGLAADRVADVERQLVARRLGLGGAARKVQRRQQLRRPKTVAKMQFHQSLHKEANKTKADRLDRSMPPPPATAGADATRPFLDRFIRSFLWRRILLSVPSIHYGTRSTASHIWTVTNQVGQETARNSLAFHWANQSNEKSTFLLFYFYICKLVRATHKTPRPPHKKWP